LKKAVRSNIGSCDAHKAAVAIAPMIKAMSTSQASVDFYGGVLRTTLVSFDFGPEVL
jgi:hypothetical protein